MNQLKKINPIYRNLNSTDQSLGISVKVADVNPVIDEVNSHDTRITELEEGSNIFTELSIQGDVSVGNGFEKLKTKTASVTFSGTNTALIEVEIPVGAKIEAVQLRNDTLLVLTTATSYSATYSNLTWSIQSEIALTKNTKVNKIFDSSAQSPIVVTEENILLTANDEFGTLDTGTVSAVVYYWELTSITDAP